MRQKLEPGLPEALGIQDLRIAILGGATTGFLEQPLKLELETHGISCELFCGDYNTFVSEMMDKNSDTATFNPDITFLLLTPYNISDWPVIGDTPDEVDELAERVSNHWLGLCESFHSITGSEIIVNNMHMLPVRPSGNLGCRLPWDRNSFLGRINQKLGTSAPPYVHILDVASLSSLYGISRWFDIRYWHHSRQPVAFECIVPFVRNVSAIISGIYGRSCKCVVLDLDNTLWGGVVGDDGIEGIRVGEGDAESESFKSFQEYLLELKNRGVLLAVCSKNNEDIALAAFEQLPEMVLKRDDFVSFKANWDTKPENLLAIAEELNIGLDAMLFVDDNPAEREHVRQALPGVKVLELSDDPALYPALLDQCGLLEPVSITSEDREKTDQYHKNAKRKEIESTHSDYDGYLKSLEQRAEIRNFEPNHLDRITQLINKTNQFNLTTRRLSRSEVEALMNSEDAFSIYVRLVDRFGDNGLISVLSGHKKDNILYVDLWLMSCRVFKRGIEYLLANYLFEHADELGIDTVHGIYIPTAKNSLVKNLYESLGFQKIDEDDNKSSWEIRVKDYEPASVHVSLM
jgi:FkbH-like protein